MGNVKHMLYGCMHAHSWKKTFLLTDVDICTNVAFGVLFLDHIQTLIRMSKMITSDLFHCHHEFKMSSSCVSETCILTIYIVKVENCQLSSGTFSQKESLLLEEKKGKAS